MKNLKNLLDFCQISLILISQQINYKLYGYLTTFTIHNDALGAFEKHPEEFAEALFEAMNRANRSYRAETVGFHGYCNYIESQPSFHADDHQIYVHCGNSVFNLNPYREDFKQLLKNNPSVAEDYVERAEFLLKECKRQIKKAKEEAKKEI